MSLSGEVRCEQYVGNAQLKYLKRLYEGVGVDSVGHSSRALDS
jgi:hypothetical protein